MINPIRRSRKIGRTQGGRVKDGRALEKESRFFTRPIWERLSSAPEGGETLVLRENPSRSFYHPCSGEEIRNVISRLPNRDTRPIKAIVLRRTSKQDYRRGIEARKRFACIILNAFPSSNVIHWGEKKPPDNVFSHYEPWCKNWEANPGGWHQIWTAEEAKRYYLYHLLLHEIGHFNQPWSIHKTKRESFAEDYALRWARKLLPKTLRP